jgi:hypothetical protein
MAVSNKTAYLTGGVVGAFAVALLAAVNLRNSEPVINTNTEITERLPVKTGRTSHAPKFQNRLISEP